MSDYETCSGGTSLSNQNFSQKDLEKLKIKEDITLRPTFLDEFIEARTKKTYWAKKEEELNPKVKEYLKLHPNHKDIYWTKSVGKPKYDAVLLYQLIAKKVPLEVLESVTIKTIDESRLDELLIAEYINPTDLDGCWIKGKETERVEIPENRKRKKETHDHDSGAKS